MVKKVCKQGWGCGSTCISRTKKCRSELGEDGKPMVENFAQYIARLRPEGGAAGAIARGDKEDPTKMTQAQRLLELAKDRPEGGAAGAIEMLEKAREKDIPKPEEEIDKFLNTEDEELADSEDIEDTLAYLEAVDAADSATSLREEASELIKQAFRFEDEQRGAQETLDGLDDETLEAAVAELRKMVNPPDELEEEDEFQPPVVPDATPEELSALREPIDTSEKQPWAEGAIENREAFRDFDPAEISSDDNQVAEHTKQFKGNMEDDRSTIEGMGLDPDNFISALTDYSRGGYQSMTRIERGQDDPDPRQFKERKERGYDGKNQVLNEFLDKAEPYDGDLYRGVNTNGSPEANAFYAAMNSLEPGDEFEQSNMSSYSSEKFVADGFARGQENAILFKIPKGKNTKGASIAAWSDQPDEAEVLVKKGGYRVTGVTFDEDGQKIIEIEEV